MFLTSLFETTLALTFTALEAGVSSPTFTSTGVLFLENPSTAKSFQHLAFFLTEKITLALTLKAFGLFILLKLWTLASYTVW